METAQKKVSLEAKRRVMQSACKMANQALNDEINSRLTKIMVLRAKGVPDTVLEEDTAAYADVLLRRTRRGGQ